MDLRCEPRKDKCCIYLPEVPQTERKGRKDRRKSAQLVEHLTMNRRVAGSNPAYAAAKECTASGKKINLLFCNMNTYESRKPT